MSRRQIILQLKTPRRRLRIRLLLPVSAALLLLPIVLLHVLSFVVSLHDRRMRQYMPALVTDSFGHRLRYYELKKPNAAWNIIFIHGTPGTAAIFGEQFRHPFDGADLVAFDRPGFGASGPARRNPSLEDQANAVGIFFRKAAGRRTILVGHSYGAPVALLAALKFTNQVAGVVLIGASVDPGQERTYAIQRWAHWPLVSWLLPQTLRQCNRELLTLRGDLLRLQPKLSALAVPVVLLHGGRDRQVPLANVGYLRAQLDAAAKTNLFDQLVFPDYNHFIPWEHPDAVDRALRMVTNRLGPVSLIQ